MARRNLAARVAAARPARAGLGVGNARPAGPRVGLGGARPLGGGGGGGAPSAPAAAPASAPAAPTGAPWDSQAEREWGGGETGYYDTISGLSGDWKARQEWYGLGETSNPYSQAALLSHQHEVDQRSVVNGAGLQLYAGSTVAAHGRADRRFSIGLESLRAAYEAEQARVRREEEAARHAWEREQGEIREGAVERATETEPPPAPAEGGGGAGGAGGGGSYATATNNRGKKTKIGIGGAKPAGGGGRRKGR